MRHHGCQTRIGGFRVDDGGDVYDLRARVCVCVCVCVAFFLKKHMPIVTTQRPWVYQ